MAPKKQTPPPIDRPLSRAYLRQFVGWSTAYPPGQSEPNSVRVMENMWVDRNGALSVRPGLRYLSYDAAPDLDPNVLENPGSALNLTPVGTQELFYTNDGSRALLFAVRETNGKVGFRVLLFTGERRVVHNLTDPEIGFVIPQTEDAINFDAACTHVQYLQINNRIFAMSDSLDTVRLFYVGTQKLVKKLKALTVPQWDSTQKLTVIHPDAAWINKQERATRYNLVLNPSFEVGTKHWNFSKNCDPLITLSTDVSGPWSGEHYLEMRSKPQRTNLACQPLHDVSGASGTFGWFSAPESGNPMLGKASGFMTVTSDKAGQFLVHGSRMVEGIHEKTEYHLGIDYMSGGHSVAIVKVSCFSANGVEIGEGSVFELPWSASTRYVSPMLTTPEGTTAMRVSVGGIGDGTGTSTVHFRNLVVCLKDQDTSMFHGGMGGNFFWEGNPNLSPSVYHPPQNIEFWSRNRPIRRVSALLGSFRLLTCTPGKTFELWVRRYDKNMDNVGGSFLPGNTTIYSNAAPEMSIPETNPGEVAADLYMRFYNMVRGDVIRLDAAMLEQRNLNYPAGTSEYFDGSFSNVGGQSSISRWENQYLPHESTSIQTQYVVNPPALTAETPAADTLMASGAFIQDPQTNPYKFAFFYTFENEVGESAPSQITEVRVKRDWSQWSWNLPDANGEPKGQPTEDPYLCADQLVVRIPEAVYDQAIAEGAVRWNLYGMSWSDQDPAPAYALLLERKELYPDPYTDLVSGLPYETGGLIVLTPSRHVTFDDVLLPTLETRINYSIPPRHFAGLVAGDRIILVGSPDDPAAIHWTSNRPGEYTNFTSLKGGGVKTLSSGNINLPAAVVLWQNPQSVNTITILCSGDNGVATSYYMAPAKTESSSAGSTPVMGFEETTSTPGTTSPYGAEVLNNAMYRPLDMMLLKSNASNYNISHKPMTEQISNLWAMLRSKEWIMSAQLDNRLYYLVHNPLGELLAPNCKGNEIWVYDVTSEAGTWSRFLIQGSSLKPFKVGTSTYIGVACPDGIYYLDPEARLDDYVDANGFVHSRPIPWKCETNTQGANRAHDAWAHLQQVGVVLGNFRGSLKYGVRGHTVNGTHIDVSKVVNDDAVTDEVVWDIEDSLLIRRDLKEWFFYAESIPDKESSGLIALVQYRYTPVSVNVGYEYGSIETFEYGRDAVGAGGTNTVDGTPVPMVDRTRP